METPSSTKRVTRSQTLAALNNTNANNNVPLSRKIEDSSDKGVTKSRRRNAKQQQLQDRSALIDITNDSPIVGLAMGSLETPSSALAKQKSSRAKNNIPNTPGSGEALLRGQVKTLLQKVEEEAELSKLSLENRPFLHLQGFVNSPMGLLAPTPANTPQVPNLSGDDIVLASTPLPFIEEQLKICQGVSEIFDVKKQESLESQKSLTRSLMLDFSEKSESSDSSECSSALTCQGDNCELMTNESKDKSSMAEDDNASIWSIQVNASTHDDDEEEVIIEEEEYYCYRDEYEEAEEEEEADDGGLLDELCEGISKISVKEKAMAKFEGKHTRFVYNSDDEIVEEEEVDRGVEDSDDDLRLKGLPTPKGKHVRFYTEEE